MHSVELVAGLVGERLRFEGDLQAYLYNDLSEQAIFWYRNLRMLREHINDIMVRWSPKERRGSTYDPGLFLETPEQARKLIRHLKQELDRAHRTKNMELESEVGEILSRVESLSKKFFRWEQNMARCLEAEDLREIKKLPLGF